MKFRQSDNLLRWNCFCSPPVDNAAAAVSVVFTNIDFENIEESRDVDDKGSQYGRENISQDPARVGLHFSEINAKIIQSFFSNLNFSNFCFCHPNFSLNFGLTVSLC